MSEPLEILLGVALFTGIILCLVAAILVARALLTSSRLVTVRVNDSRDVQGLAGSTLLDALGRAGIVLPAACGGKGTCGLCRLRVAAGDAALVPTEAALLTPRQRQEGMRLACQVRLANDLEVQVPEDLLGVRRVVCRVRSNTSVATFIKELVVELPPDDEPFAFRAGAFVQVACPPYTASYADIDLPPRHRATWERLGLLRLRAGTTHATERAYSLANRPSERDVLVLIVRIATPPPTAPTAPPGIVSSWIFGLRPGDPVTVSGPFGHFFATDSHREMVLVGGGAGMAPLRAHVFDQLERLHATRKISFWYGARNLPELFHAEEFDELAAAHENFQWTVALSEPGPEERWEGPVGYIHQVLFDRHLRTHPAPADCEYYLCGPPMMIAATRKLLLDLQVDPSDIHSDDFGGAG